MERFGAPRQRATGLIRADSAEWRIRELVAVRLVATAVVIAAVPLAARLSRDLYRSLLTEDGPVEWLQFVSVVLAVPVYGWLAVMLLRRNHRWLGALFLVGAVGLVVIAGEEISWGQRIFALTTPRELEELNNQGETNIHNVGSLLKVINLGTVAVTLAACLLPLLRWTVWKHRTRSLAGYALVPPIALIPLFAFALGYRLVRLVLLPDPGFTVSTYQEAAELALYLGLLLFGILFARIVHFSSTRSGTVASPGMLGDAARG